MAEELRSQCSVKYEGGGRQEEVVLLDRGYNPEQLRVQEYSGRLLISAYLMAKYRLSSQISLGILLRSEYVVEKVLQQNCDHSMGRDSRVVGGQADPESEDSFTGDTFSEAVDEPVVREYSVSS